MKKSSFSSMIYRRDRFNQSRVSSRLTQWVEGPFGRLILPFFLTTVVGLVLSSGWQYATWVFQQKYLEEVDRRNVRQQFIAETIQLIANITSAAGDVLEINTHGWDKTEQKEEIKTRIETWEAARRKWFYPVLLGQLETYFSGEPKLKGTFERIEVNRKRLEANIQSLKSEARVVTESAETPEQRLRRLADESTELVNAIDKDTVELAAGMRRSIYTESRGLRRGATMTQGQDSRPGS